MGIVEVAALNLFHRLEHALGRARDVLRGQQPHRERADDAHRDHRADPDVQRHHVFAAEAEIAGRDDPLDLEHHRKRKEDQRQRGDPDRQIQQLFAQPDRDQLRFLFGGKLLAQPLAEAADHRLDLAPDREVFEDRVGRRGEEKRGRAERADLPQLETGIEHHVGQHECDDQQDHRHRAVKQRHPQERQQRQVERLDDPVAQDFPIGQPEVVEQVERAGDRAQLVVDEQNIQDGVDRQPERDHRPPDQPLADRELATHGDQHERDRGGGERGQQVKP